MNNWSTKKLGEVCDILIGGTPRRGVSKYWNNGIFPWVSIRDLSKNGKIITETEEKITKVGAEESNVKLLQKGTLLFSFKLSIGKLAFAGVDLYTNEAIAGLVIKDGKLLDKNFLYCFLQQVVFKTAIKAVKGKTLNKEKIKNLEIPIPSLEKQRRIVKRIEELFAIIDEAQKLREESKKSASALLQSSLNEIFSGPKSKNWEKKEIKETCEHPQYGFTASSSRESIGPKFLRITDIQNGKVNWDTVPYCKCSIIEKYRLLKGDIVFARTGATVGKSFLITNVPEDAIFGSYLIRLRVKNKVLPEFLYYFFQSSDYWQEITEGQVGMAQPNVNGSKLAKIKIPLPSVAEQKKIVKYLDFFSEKIRKLQDLQQKTAYDFKSLKKSILSQAFQSELIK